MIKFSGTGKWPFGIDEFELSTAYEPETHRVKCQLNQAATAAEAQEVAERVLGQFDGRYEGLPRISVFNPETVKCESCGTEIFLMELRMSSVPDGEKRWMERPVPGEQFGTVSSIQHSRDRCEAARKGEQHG